jgi:hypothetical protein
MPTFTHGKDAVLTINAVAITGISDSASLERSRDVADVTCFGDTAKRVIAGLKDGKLSFGGNEDQTLVTGLITAFDAGLVAFIYGPEGSGAGKPKESGNLIITSLKQTSSIGDKNTYEAECQIDNAITRGVYP